MSIGLGDLNKKKRVPTTAPTEIPSSRKAAPPEASAAQASSIGSSGIASSGKIKSVYKKSITARPWTESGSVKAPKNSRARPVTSDLSINNDWMSLQTEPIFWIDFREHSTLLKLNERLSHIESKIEDVVIAPIRALKAFFKSRASSQH